MRIQKHENWVRPRYGGLAYVYQVAMWTGGFSVSSRYALNEYKWNGFDKRRNCVFTWKVILYKILQNVQGKINWKIRGQWLNKTSILWLVHQFSEYSPLRRAPYTPWVRTVSTPPTKGSRVWEKFHSTPALLWLDKQQVELLCDSTQRVAKALHAWKHIKRVLSKNYSWQILLSDITAVNCFSIMDSLQQNWIQHFSMTWHSLH